MNKYIYSKPKAKKIITTIIVCVMLLLGTLSLIEQEGGE